MEKSLCPSHKYPPGILTEKIKLNWKHFPDCRHLWLSVSISLTCEGDIAGVVEVGKKEKQNRKLWSDPSQTLVQPWDKCEEGAPFCSDRAWNRLGAWGEKLSSLILAFSPAEKGKVVQQLLGFKWRILPFCMYSPKYVHAIKLFFVLCILQGCQKSQPLTLHECNGKGLKPIS